MSGNIRDTLNKFDTSGLMREPTLAHRWSKSIRTLQRWRAMGYGPPYIRLGGSVRYRFCDVLAFESTMQRGGVGQ